MHFPLRIVAHKSAQMIEVHIVHRDDIVVIVVVGLGDLSRRLAFARDAVGAKQIAHGRIHRIAYFLGARGGRSYFEGIFQARLTHFMFHHKLRHRTATNIPVTHEKDFGLFFLIHATYIESNKGTKSSAIFIFINKFVYLCAMNAQIDILKGIHPGLFLQRELHQRQLKSGPFAKSIGEHPQTLSAIIHGRRSMNTPLSLRIEASLGLEEGLLMTLQIFYDIAQEKQKHSQDLRPDLSKFRRSLFWDTSFENINFITHSRYVINRVFERGTEEEIQEIIRFYGQEQILQSILPLSESPFKENIKHHLKKYLNHDA